MRRTGGRDRWISRMLSLNEGNVGLCYANTTYEAAILLQSVTININQLLDLKNDQFIL